MVAAGGSDGLFQRSEDTNMRKLIAFEFVSLDGYFTDARNDMSWAHRDNDDPEWKAFTAENASGESQLLFGRKTCELMMKYWPTPAAKEKDPKVAGGMNTLPKLVFSRTLTSVSWANTKVVKGDPAAEVRTLKKETGPVLVIMGSGSVVAQLAAAGLIDEYQLVVAPVALGKGRTLFEGLPKTIDLKRTHSRLFKNGKVLLHYAPA
jgi:dihydrofolate reductase